jgi:epoxyqueuosine reductase
VVRVTEGSIATRVKVAARELGFDHCRIAPIGPAPHATFFADWLARGNAAEMHYLARAVDLRRNPARLAGDDAELRSLIVVAVDYHQFDLPAAIRDDPSRGILAAYAWGDDYHEIIRPLLYELDAVVRKASGRTSQGKALVDTGPVLERDWAQAAGIGFTGKHCCTIRPGQGSWLLLATLAVPEVLEYDPPPLHRGAAPSSTQVLAGLPHDAQTGQWSSVDASWTGTCGRCTRCLDACPTGAFVGPFHLDARRCIAYWTIETQASIPLALRPHFGNRIFGCDICQEVCPYNRRLPERTPLLAGLAAREERIAAPLLAGFQPDAPYWLEQEAFARHFRRSPVKRAKRAGMLRNVCVALGNWADPAAVAALGLALHDPSPVVREHAAWALGQVRTQHAGTAAGELLTAALVEETDATVRAAIAAALSGA